MNPILKDQLEKTHTSCTKFRKSFIVVLYVSFIVGECYAQSIFRELKKSAHYIWTNTVHAESFRQEL
jgi:hypothetical protein